MHPQTSWYFFYKNNNFIILCCSLHVCIYACFPSCAWNMWLLAFTGAAGWAQTHRSELMWLLFRLTYLRTHTYTFGVCFTDTSSCVKHSLIVWRVEWCCPPTQGWDSKCSPSDGPAPCSASFSILIALFPERDLVYVVFFGFFCWCAISMSEQWHN